MRLRDIAFPALGALLAACRWGTGPPPPDVESGGTGWLRIEDPGFNFTTGTSKPLFSGTMFLTSQVSNPSVVDCMFPPIEVSWTNEATGIEGYGTAIGERHQVCSIFFGECGDQFWCTNRWEAIPAVAPGANHIRIRADDGMCNWGTDLRDIAIDPKLTVPRLGILEPTSNDNWTSTALDVRLKGYAIDAIGLRWANRAFDSSGDILLSNGSSMLWEVTVFLSTGENAITVTATAANGATASDSLLVTSLSP